MNHLEEQLRLAVRHTVASTTAADKMTKKQFIELEDALTINLRDQSVLQNYAKAAATTKNDMLTHKGQLANYVMGLCGESGEVIDLVKKHLYQGHELDKAKIKNELGDIMWYWINLSTALDLDPFEILEYNVRKLKKRFPNGFSENDSINRRDTI